VENYEDELLKAIDQDVRSHSEIVTKRVNEETDSLMDDQISFYKEGLKKETDTYLESELNDLRLYAATEASRAKMDTKKKLLEMRTSLMEDLMHEVKTELRAFVKTPEYANYMKKHLDDLQVSADGYFEVRENDADLMKKILQEKGLKNEVHSVYFSIGGFRYVDEKAGMEYSCALDEKRKEQFAWFRNHSGFKLKEGNAE
jgi:vacuolar-type H+-ATPase subunit E/Vma4